MQLFKHWAPTRYDAKGHGPEHLREWYVLGVIKTRDSGLLDRSNFAVALDMLGGESETVEVHRFNHWASGWFDIILLHPEKVAEGTAIEDRLENYPILDEDHYSTLEYETAADYWEHMSIRERLDWCKAYHVSIFAARRDAMPNDENGALLQALGE